MQALSFIPQVSQKPVLFFRALRSGITTAGHWTRLSDDWALHARYTHIFSAVHGFLGVRKLISAQHIEPTPLQLWGSVKRVKKFVAAIGWFCKAGRDKGYFNPSFAAWTSYVKIVQVPFDCVSLGFSLFKISRICIRLIGLAHATKNNQVSAQMVILQRKAIQEIFYSASKFLDISAFLVEMIIPSSFVIVSVNSIAATAVKVSALSFALISSRY